MGRTNRADRRWRSSWVFAIASVFVGALWLLFTGSSKLHECEVGAVAVAGTMCLLTAVYRQELQGFDLRWTDAFALWRTPWYLISGIGEITLVLLKDLAGQRAESIFRVCGFRSAKDDPRMVTRRALATAYTSIAPNFIVVGIDYDQSRMLFHQIRRSSVPRMTKQLGAVVGTHETAPGDATAHVDKRRSST